jgi:dipeptidyl aminopeptidase/acylaminoacyl peptidase
VLRSGTNIEVTSGLQVVNGGKEFVQVLGYTPPANTRPASGPTGVLVSETSSGGSIYTINADGTNLRYLTDGLDPALSPDRQWVAFARWDFPYGLYIIKTDGSGERQLFGAPLVKAPAWSPDGSQIAYLTNAGGQWDVWVMDANGENPHTMFKPGTLRGVTFDYENVDERVISWR